MKEETNFKVTEAAAQAIKKYLAENEAVEGAGLRVGIRGGGCSGLSYSLDVGFLQDGDHVFECSGQVVYIDKKSMVFLNGCELDYKKGLLESGFDIKNPKAKSTCGCGESFGI